MSATPPVLLTTAQRTTTGALLIEQALRRGLTHAIADGPLTVQPLHGRTVHWYGGPLAADRLAGSLDLGLLEPSDGWLAELPREFTGRRVELTTLAEAWALRRPAFVKPPSDKQFPAAVYADGARLPRTGDRIGPDTPVLVSDVVTFAVEFRFFVLDGRVRTGSRYARFGRLDPAPLTADPDADAALVFAHRLLTDAAHTLPSAVTLDVGRLHDPDTGAARWAAVEANMPWFSHTYAAAPSAALDVVLRATGPRSAFATRDRRYLRPVPAP
ncbi:ATP-grasp domain-containing protein [Kitasatospora sp. NPDC049285]|uniref:ATP-grasp domain-containing protein n=1 Tax=Kitasatospora sp. NPDC049285 TaxID=3157096 RepID=UPI003434ED4A